MSKKSSEAATLKADKAFRLVRKRLADGTVKEYLYPRKPQTQAPRFAPDSLDAVLAAYRRSPHWADLSPRTRENYAIYLRPLDRIGHLRLKDVKRRTLIEIRDAIAQIRGNGAATGFVRAAQALFSWAVDADRIEHSPADNLKVLRGGHLPAWTEPLLREALARLPEPYRRVVILAVYTGQRRGDLISMTWAAYDGRSISLRQQKDRRANKPLLVIPCHHALRAELDAWKVKDRSATTILTSPRGLPWTAAHLTREMGREVATLGFGRFTPHGLRKLAATRLAEAGCTPHEIAAITGHQTLAMIDFYTKSASQAQLARSAITRLEDARKRRETGDG